MTFIKFRYWNNDVYYSFYLFFHADSYDVKNTRDMQSWRKKDFAKGKIPLTELSQMVQRHAIQNRCVL